MGGTTAKLCLLTKGRAAAAREFEVDRAERFKKHSGLPVQIPCLDLVEISGGGGSIASTNAVAAVTVGPQSAGAAPGPACYGRGGLAATVTDADLILGRLDASAAFAGGRLQLQPQLSRSALRAAISEPQAFESDEAAAAAVAEAVEEATAAAARAHAAEHGRELGQEALIAFGGAAPLHAAAVAERLGLPKVFVPPDASVGSAIGFLSAPLAFEAVKSCPMLLDPASFDPEVANGIFRSLWHETICVVAAGAARWKPGRPAKEIRRAYGRYCGQGKEVAIDLPNNDLTVDDWRMLKDKFEEAYKKLFSRSIDGASVEIKTWALEVVGDSDPLTWSLERAAALKSEAPRPLKKLRVDSAARRALFCTRARKVLEAPVYWRDDLAVGSCVCGPCIIAEKYTSTLVTAAFECSVLENGFLQLDQRMNDCGDPRSQLSLGSDASAATHQIMWKRLIAAVEEQARLLVRGGFSPLIRESHIVACGLFDAAGRMIAQSETCEPGLAGALFGVVERFFGPTAAEGLSARNGDAFISNNPWISSGHPCEFTLVSPFGPNGKQALGYIACSARVTNVRSFALAGSSIAEDIYLPVTRLACDGRVDEDVIAKLRAASGRPDEIVGDVFAMLASNDQTARRVREIMTEYCVQDLQALSDFVFDASRHAITKAIMSLPKGSWSSEAQVQIDDSSAKLTLHATMRVQADKFVVSLDGEVADGCSDVGEPSTKTLGHTYFALISLFARDVPRNSGLVSAFSVDIHADSVLNLPAGRPVSSRSLSHLLPDVLFNCCSQLSLQNAPAESALAPYFIDLTGAPDVCGVYAEAGGAGASERSDGLSAAALARATQVEIIEGTSPLRFLRRELRCDSGGAGRHRGGLGLSVEIASLSAVDLMLPMVGVQHLREAAKPRTASSGASAAAYIKHGTRKVAAHSRIQLPEGLSLIVQTAGGGGYGPPNDRCRKRLAEDVQNGFVSRQAAMQVYGAKRNELDA
eukprot:TRINITY_DN38073_c0_g1_i1.p1 TRINITY_DN38073_c0_g1~~TRINITY_DN38073_c0_g1_i1.p1  ORF type:complete len:1071 (-),score=216.44 TRINITY_DN38073_c0_g1_i1:203-3145(-)